MLCLMQIKLYRGDVTVLKSVAVSDDLIVKS